LWPNLLFVDPGTGAIRGDLTTYGSSGALPMRTWISNLHRSLNLGEPGRIYSELAASWLGVVALGGLVLWIGRLRRRTTPKRPRPTSGRARTLWLHGTTGTILLAGFLFLAVSGLTWSAHAGDNITALRTSLGWLPPTVSTSLNGQPSAPAGDRSGPGPLRHRRADSPGPHHHRAHDRHQTPATASAVAIDPASEKITSRADF
jgi:uncharacterized iron-regulated membrane protein